MRRAIGERLIDKAETLHTEVISLLDIWRDYRSTIEAEESECPIVQLGRGFLLGGRAWSPSSSSPPRLGTMYTCAGREIRAAWTVDGHI